MTSGFHPNELNPQLSNYPVSKGDVEGHEFHGNQWKHIGNAISKIHDEAHAIAGRAKGMLAKAYAYGLRPSKELHDKHYAIHGAHVKAYGKLDDLINKLSEKLPYKHPVMRALAKASQLHYDASDAHLDAAISPLTKGAEAEAASRAAAKATDDALREHAFSTDSQTGGSLR